MMIIINYITLLFIIYTVLKILTLVVTPGTSRTVIQRYLQNIQAYLKLELWLSKSNPREQNIMICSC